MWLNQEQIQMIARMFSDLAKILFASAVVGFFIPGFSGSVSLPTFVIGAVFTAGFFVAGVAMLKSPNST